MSKEETARPPYVPFQTFLGFIGKLSKTALPPAIDASLMTSMSGATQSHLRVALRFLGMIQGPGIVTDRLRAVVKAHGTSTWPEALGNAISEAYGEILAGVDLDSGTIAQLKEAFRTRGKAENQVLDKAVRFYLSAMQEAKLTISPHFEPRRGAGGASRQQSAQSRSSRKPSKKRGSGQRDQGTPNDDVHRTPVIDTPSGFMVHPFQLRRDMPIKLALPMDLTAADVDRLAKFLATLPLEES